MFVQRLVDLKTKIEKIDSDLKLTFYKTRQFEPNVRLQFERGNYLVKTVTDGDELEACLKLRFEVFHREYQKKNRTVGVDIDRLDFVCDHLAIIDRSANRVIGTYRLNSSRFSDAFYSTGEFHLDRLLEVEGHKLELGRACIDRNHRNGIVLTLLWRGIVEYIQATETRIMFGCASVKTIEPMQIASVTKYIETLGVVDRSFGVSPRKNFKIHHLGYSLDYLENNPESWSPSDAKKLVPSLMSSYLKMNAKVCGEPALDRDFGCIDFLTMIDVSKMSANYKEKYKL